MEQNNDEIIAVFTGWVIDNSFPDKNHVYRLGGRIETKNTFKFSSSFDFLMPSIKKWNDLHVMNMIELSTDISSMYNSLILKLKSEGRH